MTRDEILALSDEELRVKTAQLLGWTQISRYAGRKPTGIFPGGYEAALPDYPYSIAAAWELFNAVYDKRSPLYGGAWVLGTVDDGKDCAQATLFCYLPWRERWEKAWESGEVEKVDKYEAIEKPDRMARAITLVYVMAMEDARGNE